MIPQSLLFSKKKLCKKTQRELKSTKEKACSSKCFQARRLELSSSTVEN